MTTQKAIIGIRITKRLNEDLKKVADYFGMTKNGLINQILNEYVEKNNGGEKNEIKRD